jgi:nucleoporin POM152
LADPLGQAPYEATYRYTTAGHTSRHTLKSAQETGILHLNTEPGQHRYDFTELKDANYASNPIQLSVEHDVYSRPSVSFIKSNTKPLCLDQQLKTDAKIRLEGKAPFTINLAVRKPASSKVESHTVVAKSNEWTLDLPLAVTEIGRYEVSIVSMSDISDCEQVVHETDRLSTTVEVVESARIVSVSQTKDLCVGDTLDFLLQGKAPWTIE